MHYIKQAVVNLRKNPSEIERQDYSHQAERLSQLTCGEPVFVHKELGNWLFVSLPEQLQVRNKRWLPYQGFLHKSEVSSHQKRMHTYSFFKRIDRKLLLKESSIFMELPYLWGGCSPPVPNTIASVDCSGLMYQLYKMQGRLIPRDAHDQFLAAQPLKNPQPADLLFLKPLDAPKRVTHVILLYNKEYYLEAPESGKNVRLLKIGSEFWYSNGLFHFFDRPKAYLGTFGTFF